MKEHRIKVPHPIRAVRLATPSPGAGAQPEPSLADDPSADAPAQAATVNRRICDCLENLSVQLDELELKRSRSLTELQVVTVELAVTLAERLTHQTLAERAHDIQRLVAAAIEECQHHRPVVIRLHADDLQQLQGQLSESQRATYASDRVEWQADSRLSRGDCQADLADYSLRFDWRHQLQELHTQLLQGLKDAQTERRTPETDGEALQRFPDRRETA